MSIWDQHGANTQKKMIKENKLSPYTTQFAVTDGTLEKVRREGYEVRPKTPDEIHKDVKHMKKLRPNLFRSYRNK